MLIRELKRGELESVWDIDRSEIVEDVYYLRDGKLALEAEHYDMKGWPDGEREQYTPLLYDCFDRGGAFYGAFEGRTLAGAAILESAFIGTIKDQLQLKFLHIGRPYRGRGLGKTLFKRAERRARDLGARRLYISSTPSENTVGFYLNLGCIVTNELNAKLYELEPSDIHLEYAIPDAP